MSTLEKPIQACGYLRVSGVGQQSGDGFDRQRKAIEAFALANGIEVVGWFSDVQTGKDEWQNRPGWSSMMEALNGTRTILVERLDRVARSVLVQELILKDLKQRNIQLLTSAGDDTGDEEPERVMFRQMLAVFAQYERTLIVRKMAGARKKIRDAGEKCEGPKFYGHTPEEQAAVNWMRRMRTGGYSFCSIAELADMEGVKTRSGGKWSAGTVCKILARGESSLDATITEFLEAVPPVEQNQIETKPKVAGTLYDKPPGSWRYGY